MSYAYTPGLKVKKSTVVQKRRILPLAGEVLVKIGDMVNYDTVVARTFVPGGVDMIPVAYILGVEPYQLPKVMLKKEGDPVKEGELIALSKGFLGLFKSEYRSKITGSVELISDATGMMAIRSQPIPIQRTAYLPGRIVDVEPKFGVAIETNASIIQGIFGFGGERHGNLMIVARPDEVLTENHVGQNCSGKILVGGALVTAPYLKKAEEAGAVGVVAGGMRRGDLTSFLGYEVGVAITGTEDTKLTCIITEGFGKMTMAHRTYELLKSLDGMLAAINGATQIRAGVIRPEVIVARDDLEVSTAKKEALSTGMVSGTRVRIIRQPYFGFLGNIVALPVNLQKLESGSRVRVTDVKLDDGRQVTVPRANVELVEE